MLKVVKITEDATIPVSKTKLSAGYDLFSPRNVIIRARQSCLILLDLKLVLPKNTYGRIAPRSGLALSLNLGINGGVIDNDFRGNIGVILVNHSDTDVDIYKYMRIAQLIVEPYKKPKIIEISDNLTNTERGGDGFGSTGLY